MMRKAKPLPWGRQLGKAGGAAHAFQLVIGTSCRQSTCLADASCCAGVQDVTVISEDGSPHGPKCFVLWNPPLTHMDAKKVSWAQACEWHIASAPA